MNLPPRRDRRRLLRANWVSPRRRARMTPRAPASTEVHHECSFQPKGRNPPPGARPSVRRQPLFAGSRERLRRFHCCIASRLDESVAVGHLQLRQPLLLVRFGFDLVGLRQRREQRLRLGDLRHFRRRRKAFERGREDGVGVGGAGGRLIEFRQRQRRAQFKTARALLLRDGDGGQEGVFRGRGVGGVAPSSISPRARCSSASNAR